MIYFAATEFLKEELMENKYVYFQPQYVGEFICDASRCNSNCCERGWNIGIDEATYQKYLRYLPQTAEFFKYDAGKGKYLLTEHPCPFLTVLTEKKLCYLQLEYGEDFLSPTCRSYPRVTTYFGKFFERALTLTCPLAAKSILFSKEPLSFELVEVTEKVLDGRIIINTVNLDEKISAHVIEIQIAMISILQERTLTLDQRLIVLGFFLDALDEIFSTEPFDNAALTKLISAYESKKFLMEQVPRLLRVVKFDAKKFAALMFELADKFYGTGKFTDAVSKIAANGDKLKTFKKNFLSEHATFLENFLVNELFINCYPFRFERSIIRNFGVFAIKYKIFELTFLLAALKNPLGDNDLIALANWFATQFDHVEAYHRQIFDYLRGRDDALDLMNSLLEGDL